MTDEKHWSEEEDFFIEEEFCAGVHVPDIAIEMGVCVQQVKSRLYQLGLTETSAKKQWTQEEDLHLARLFHERSSLKDMAFVCRASVQQIKRRLKKLGLSRMSEYQWSPEEMEFVRLNVREFGYAETGRRIGRSKAAVIEFLKRAHFDNPMARTNYWSQSDKDEVVRLRLETGLTWEEIGARVGRTGDACRAECGWQVKEAQKANPSVAVPQKTARPLVKRWTPQEDEEVLRSKETGLSWHEIGKRVGRTGEASRERWRQLSRRDGRMSS